MSATGAEGFAGRAAAARLPRLDASAPFDRGAKGVYAALDLGTNNCRLLVAKPTRDPTPGGAESFRIIDAFSRIVRLGEGLGQNGLLSEAAIARTIDALLVCRDKMAARDVSRARLIATEACRAAENGEEFVVRVREETGLELEIIGRETEARLAATGCAALADSRAKSVLLFDIGGGSSEIVWLSPKHGARNEQLDAQVRHWTSLHLGVVTLAERFGGAEVSFHQFTAMTELVVSELQQFLARSAKEERCNRFHLLGTSGTVTTLAGVHLNLARYDRRRVDGLWMSHAEIDAVMMKLRAMTFAERARNACIGPDRADLVLAGCAILEGIRRCFPSERVRIADRGLREGMLLELMRADKSFA
ncbi:exopolyphosphatase [Rhodoblastus sphagnicola]|uniref:Exopolyphosphatase n=1 Tax=Rhodoblastus sphagnicola TaxID=333368 RepID=A0A2S6N7I1_9HYPH|nr:exopolyphosphatase [Rhodoblastus sphagnicola]